MTIPAHCFSLAAAIAVLIVADAAFARTAPRSIAECAAIDADADRLACYDRAAGRAPAPSTAAKPASSEPPPTVAEKPASAASALRAPPSLIDAAWGFEPGSNRYIIDLYNQNYLLVARYTDHLPFTPLFQAAGQEENLDHTEAKFQISFKMRLWTTDDRRWVGYDVFPRVDFGLSVRDPATGIVHRRPPDASLGVYKLHGSLNWLRCDLCDNVYLNPIGAIAYVSFLLGNEADRRKRDTPWLAELEAKGANQCHCGYRPLRHVLVAPSFVREVRDPILLEMWRSALEALRRADEWIIVGYSLPPEDVAIRSMLLRAYNGRDAPEGKDAAKPPRIVVVQKERREPEETRYRLMFPQHDYVVGGLAGYLGALKEGGS